MLGSSVESLPIRRASDFDLDQESRPLNAAADQVDRAQRRTKPPAPSTGLAARAIAGMSHGPPAGVWDCRRAASARGLIVVAIERAEPIRGKKAALIWIT
jgi:hypothetical protein